MSLTIREATSADYPVMARIWSELHPNHACTAEAFAREIQEGRENPLGLHLAYWVAEHAGEVVAYGSIEQYGGLYHADRYHAGVLVLPTVRGQGIGTALAETLHAHLQQRKAREVLAGCYESDVAAPNLLARYGLVEIQRYFDSHLDLTTFDFPAWTEKTGLPQGVRLLSYVDLQGELGEEQATRVYFDLFTDTVRDVPAPGERVMPTLERFRKRLENEHFRPESVFLTLTADNHGVAFTELWTSEDNDSERLKIGFTCTRREWRGKGLALALKLHAMKKAHEDGFKRITTNAESGNAPMLSLNDRLGFQRAEAYIESKWGNV